MVEPNIMDNPMSAENFTEHVADAKLLEVNKNISVYFWWNTMGLKIEVWESKGGCYRLLNEYGCET